MAIKREKRPVIQPVTLEQAEGIMADYATVDAQIEEITAKMDQQMTQIREKFQDKLVSLGEIRTEKLNQLQLFAESNTDLFQEKKSIDMAHGRIGFRTGTPKLKTLKGFTWAAVTNLLKKSLPQFVRTVDEPAKDMLIASRDKADVADMFRECGFECIQEETFFAELKKEEFAEAK